MATYVDLQEDDELTAVERALNEAEGDYSESSDSRETMTDAEDEEAEGGNGNTEQANAHRLLPRFCEQLWQRLCQGF